MAALFLFSALITMFIFMFIQVSNFENHSKKRKILFYFAFGIHLLCLTTAILFFIEGNYIGWLWVINAAIWFFTIRLYGKQ
jgi:Na+/melibiose symporter-like transporter